MEGNLVTVKLAESKLEHSFKLMLATRLMV